MRANKKTHRAQVNKVYKVPALKSSDIQALAEFLAVAENPPESLLHRLLEKNPGLLAVFGYVHFLSEYPLAKRNQVGEISQNKNRLDILAARPSVFDPNILYADIIELKATSKRISQSRNPQRLSPVASAAIAQLYTYETELTTNLTISQELKSLGLTIAKPQKILIFGRDAEFVGEPYAYEMILAQFRENNIIHYTADRLLHLAEQLRHERLGGIIAAETTIEHVELLMAGNRNWKISMVEGQVVAQESKGAISESDLYAWQRRNPGMIFVPKGYEARANEGYVMYCQDCGSENISSKTYYESRPGHYIGDEDDPCIVCGDCGAVDISPGFRRP